MKQTAITSHSVIETKQIAARFARGLKAQDVVLLSGHLGAGKSVFARTIIETLARGHIEEVPSPTFTLVQEYDTIKGPLWHFDLYRIDTPEEIYELGWEDIVAQELAVVEWPERLGFLRPREYIQIDIQPTEQDKREIIISFHSE